MTSTPGRSHRKKVLRVAGLLLGVAVLVVAAVAAMAFRGEKMDITWAPVEAGADGRSLVVRPLMIFSACDRKPTGKIDGAAGGIRVSYRHRPCASLVGRSFPTITVPLGRPLTVRRSVA